MLYFGMNVISDIITGALQRGVGKKMVGFVLCNLWTAL